MDSARRQITIPDSVKNAIEWVVCFRYRRSARRKRVATASVREGAIESVVRIIRNHGSTFKGFRRIGNICLYVLLIDQDLSELMTDMSCAIGVRRKNFVARQLAVLLYEASFDLADLVGKDYRRALSVYNLRQEWIDELNGVTQKLQRFKDNHSVFLKSIRNVVAAHREQDAITQYELMSGINPLEVVKLGPEFQAAVNQLIALQMKLMEHWRTLEVADKDYFDSLLKNY